MAKRKQGSKLFALARGLRWGWLTLAVFGLTAINTDASAQDTGFSLSRFRPPPLSTDGIVLPTTDSLGRLGWSGRLSVGYGYAPLRVTMADRTQETRVVEHWIDADLSIGVGLGHGAQLFLSAPMVIAQSGDDFPGAFASTSSRGTAFGDLRVGGMWTIVGDGLDGAGGEFRFGVRGWLGLPTGSESDLAGDGSTSGQLTAVASIRTGATEPMAYVGGRLRAMRTVVVDAVGHEVVYGIGSRFHLSPALVEIAVQGSTTVVGNRSFTSVTNPLELQLGATFEFGAAYVGAGLGLGLTDAIGTPTARAFAVVGIANRNEESEDPEIGDGEPDFAGDGPVDPADGDGDGVVDGDFCPVEPETRNGYLDRDGCPDGVARSQTHLVVTPGVIFERNSSRIEEDQKPALVLIAEILEDDPSIRFLQIEGHASVGELDALALSERRAEHVKEALVVRGIDPSRLTAVGIGDGQPLEGEPPRYHRRVELRILDL